MIVEEEALFALLRFGLSLESNCNNNTDIYTLLDCKKWRNIFQLCSLPFEYRQYSHIEDKQIEGSRS